MYDISAILDAVSELRDSLDTLATDFDLLADCYLPRESASLNLHEMEERAP